MFLDQQGCTSILNLEGGVAGWADQVDADFPRY